MGTVKEHLNTLLKQDLKAKGLCIWLDAQSDYTGFVDEISAHFPYPVLRFRGSFLELMLEMETHLADKINKPCLIHMPGFNQSTIRETPVLEAYKAGKELQYSLKTVFRTAAAGKLSPNLIEGLIAQNDFSLALADARLSEEDQTPDGMRRLLGKLSRTEIILDLLQEQTQVHELLEAPSETRLGDMLAFLHLNLGFDQTWLQHFHDGVKHANELRALRLPLAAHLLCAEYVGDLAVEPVFEPLKALRNLSAAQLGLCREISTELRERLPEHYVSFAEEIEPLLQAERVQPPMAYGQIDTFAFEEESMVAHAFDALEARNWATVSSLAAQRLGAPPKSNRQGTWASFWVQRDPGKQWLWRWLEQGTRLAEQIERAQNHLKDWNPKKLTPAQMLEQYTSGLYRVDQLHRDFEQWSAHIRTQTNMPFFTRVSAVMHHRRQEYRDFLNTLTALFAQACAQHGYLPSPNAQQRYFHAQVVEPELKAGPLVVFYVDAFRYELGEALARQLKSEHPGSEVTLSARLSELPSVTAVGMNALLPLEQQGQLVPDFDKRKGKFIGFRTAEKLIDGPHQREKLLRERLQIPLAWIALKELSEMAPEQLRKQLKGKQLVIVHSLEIDELGETGLLPLFPDYFEKTLSRLSTAIQRLQQSDYQRFVLTSDHGFIQADETLRGERLPHVEVSSRRYILHQMALESPKVTSVSLSQLNYQPSEKALADLPGWLIFAPSGDLFNEPGSRDRFYHGGNSLQERVIPIIVLRTKGKQPAAVEEDFKLEIEALPTMMGHQRICLKASLKSQSAINWLSRSELVLDLTTPPESATDLTIVDLQPGVRQANQLKIPLDTRVEIFFKIHGTSAAKVPLLIIQPDAQGPGAQFLTQEYFDVEAIPGSENPGSTRTEIPKSGPAESSVFSEQIDSVYHPILTHLMSHGSVTEVALSSMLGGGSKGARLARKFAARIEDWLSLLPFNLEVEQTAEGKTYRKV